MHLGETRRREFVRSDLTLQALNNSRIPPPAPLGRDPRTRVWSPEMASLAPASEQFELTRADPSRRRIAASL
jgi:hypothetical protein